MSNIQNILTDGFAAIDRKVENVCQAYKAPRFETGWLNNGHIRAIAIKQEKEMISDPRSRRYS